MDKEILIRKKHAKSALKILGVQKIKFLDIARTVENTLGKLSGITADSLEDVISVDNEARAKAAEEVSTCSTVVV